MRNCLLVGLLSLLLAAAGVLSRARRAHCRHRRRTNDDRARDAGRAVAPLSLWHWRLARGMRGRTKLSPCRLYRRRLAGRRCMALPAGGPDSPCAAHVYDTRNQAF
jgi:hypothetical protein